MVRDLRRSSRDSKAISREGDVVVAARLEQRGSSSNFRDPGSWRRRGGGPRTRCPSRFTPSSRDPRPTNKRRKLRLVVAFLRSTEKAKRNDESAERGIRFETRRFSEVTVYGFALRKGCRCIAEINRIHEFASVQPRNPLRTRSERCASRSICFGPNAIFLSRTEATQRVMRPISDPNGASSRRSRLLRR